MKVCLLKIDEQIVLSDSKRAQKTGFLGWDSIITSSHGLAEYLLTRGCQLNRRIYAIGYRVVVGNYTVGENSHQVHELDELGPLFVGRQSL